MDVTNVAFVIMRRLTIEYLFLKYPFARIVWHIVYMTYNIPPPINIKNKFGNWSNGIDKKNMARIRIGVSALCRSLWRCRNNIVFNIAGSSNFL